MKTSTLTCMETGTLTCMETSTLTCMETSTLTCMETSTLTCMKTSTLTCMKTSTLTCMETSTLTCMETSIHTCLDKHAHVHKGKVAGVCLVIPDPSLHSTEFDIFPDLGVPLRVKLRMQMNVVLDQNQALNRARHFDMIYPIFWFEAGIDSLPVNLVGQLQMAQDLPPLMKQIFVVICGVLSVVFFILLMAQTFTGWCSGGLSSFRGSRGSSNETILTVPPPETQTRESMNADVEFPDSGAYKSFASPQLISGDRPNKLIDNHTLLPPYKKSNSLSADERGTTAVDGHDFHESPGKRKLVGTNSDSCVQSKFQEPDESKNDYPPDYHVVASSGPVDRSSSTRSTSSVVSAEVEFHRSGSYLDLETPRKVVPQSIQPNEFPVQSDVPTTYVTLPNEALAKASRTVVQPQTSTPHPDLPHPLLMNLKPLPSVPRIIEKESLKKSSPAVSVPLASPEYDEVPVEEDEVVYADVPSRTSHPLATSSPYPTVDDIHPPQRPHPPLPPALDAGHNSTNLSRLSVKIASSSTGISVQDTITRNMDSSFSGRRALVTGGGSGMGRATALQLAQLGAKVFALSNVQADLDSLKYENPDIEILCVDLRDWNNTREAVKNITPIHLLVNCAGVATETAFTDVPEEEFNLVFDVNVKAILNVTQVVAKDLIDRNEKGNIVNVASVFGHIGYHSVSTYCASKAAVVSYTKTMAVELSPKGIRVNAVSPTFVLTNISKVMLADGVTGPLIIGRTPMGKIAEIKNVVDAIVYLLSEKSGMVNGHSLAVDGGLLCC
ncbi:CD36 family [Trinorchestia longiramus]|nr:CD36 family [Trinorchestia longiramus]